MYKAIIVVPLSSRSTKQLFFSRSQLDCSPSFKDLVIKLKGNPGLIFLKSPAKLLNIKGEGMLPEQLELSSLEQTLLPT